MRDPHPCVPADGVTLPWDKWHLRGCLACVAGSEQTRGEGGGGAGVVPSVVLLLS